MLKKVGPRNAPIYIYIYVYNPIMVVLYYLVVSCIMFFFIVLHNVSFCFCCRFCQYTVMSTGGGSIEALCDALKVFQGAVIFVTHNRYLIEEAADCMLVVGGQGIKADKASLVDKRRFNIPLGG